MLIVVSGVESIHKRLISRQIINSLIGPFHVDGYIVDFINDEYDIIDSNDNRITTEELVKNPDGTANTAGRKTLNKMEAIEDKYFLSGAMHKHYFNRFVDVGHDWGCLSLPEWPKDRETEDLMHYSANYSSVIKQYNGCEDNYMVITGSFCKNFIDRLKADLGEDNVLVYNITRNPSTVSFLHKKADSYFEGSDYTQEWDNEKLWQSLLTAAKLKQDPSIHTVKFEDMIRTHTFEVDGQNVGIYLDYESANGHLTEYEYANRNDVNVATADDITQFNEVAANFDPTVLDIDLELGAPLVGLNLFELLDYEALTYEQINISKSEAL